MREYLESMKTEPRVLVVMKPTADGDTGVGEVTRSRTLPLRQRSNRSTFPARSKLAFKLLPALWAVPVWGVRLVRTGTAVIGLGNRTALVKVHIVHHPHRWIGIRT